MPFIVVCALHSLEVLDATPWYSLFSMMILPINSVINPFLYDEVVTVKLKAPFLYIWEISSNSTISQSFVARFRRSSQEVINMNEIEALGATVTTSAEDGPKATSI